VKKQLEKGIAFPTCLTTNEKCGHFSPLKSED
jgi:methionine aminopeptidase